VTAAAPMAVAAMPTAGGSAGAAQAEEQTEFDAILKVVGEKKMALVNLRSEADILAILLPPCRRAQ